MTIWLFFERFRVIFVSIGPNFTFPEFRSIFRDAPVDFRLRLGPGTRLSWPSGASTPWFEAGRPGKWDEIRAGMTLEAT